MAIDTEIICERCGNRSLETHSVRSMTPRVCSQCIEKDRESERQTHLDKCAAMPIEVRLTKIEAALYDKVNQPYDDGIIG